MAPLHSVSGVHPAPTPSRSTWPPGARPGSAAAAHRTRGPAGHRRSRRPDTDALQRARWEELARTRSEDLRAEMIAEFLPLANRLARRFAAMVRPGIREDLAQAAALGLVKAVDGFRPELGFQFTTYATPTIIGEMKRAMRIEGWAVHAPRRLQERHLGVNQAVDLLTQELGREPTAGELAVATGYSEEDVDEAIVAGRWRRAVGLDAPVGEGDVLSAILGEDDRALDMVDEMLSVSAAIRQLPPRERRIIELRFGRDRTEAEIAGALGLSQVHVGRLLRRSLDVLRVVVTARGAVPA